MNALEGGGGNVRKNGQNNRAYQVLPNLPKKAG